VRAERRSSNDEGGSQAGIELRVPTDNGEGTGRRQVQRQWVSHKSHCVPGIRKQKAEELRVVQRRVL
jgi:hypothetical protein